MMNPLSDGGSVFVLSLIKFLAFLMIYLLPHLSAQG